MISDKYNNNNNKSSLHSRLILCRWLNSSRSRKMMMMRDLSTSQERDWSAMDDFPVFIIASKLSWTPWITSVSSQFALLGSHPLRRATLGSLSLSSSSAILASMNPHTSISFFSYFCGSCSQRWLAFVDGAAGRMYLQNPVTGELIWLPETSDASWNAQSLRRPKFIQMYFWNLKIHLPLKVAISSVPTDPDCVCGCHVEHT